jgi:hypothetical protein
LKASPCTWVMAQHLGPEDLRPGLYFFFGGKLLNILSMALLKVFRFLSELSARVASDCSPHHLLVRIVDQIDDQRSLLLHIARGVARRPRSPPAPPPVVAVVVVLDHGVLLDPRVVDDLQIRVSTGVYFCQSGSGQLRIHTIHHALRPQTLRRMLAVGPCIGLELGEVGIAIPVDIHFLRPGCARGQQH